MTVLRHLTSTVAGKVPDVSQLSRGVIAINHTDGMLYFRHDTPNGPVIASLQSTPATSPLQPVSAPSGASSPTTISFLQSDITATTTGDFGQVNNTAQLSIASPLGGRAIISFNSINALATKIGVDPSLGFVIGGWSLPANALIIDPVGNASAAGAFYASTAEANQMVVAGNIAGAPVFVQANGSDANISISYVAKGSGTHNFNSEVVGSSGVSGNQFRLVSNIATPAIILRNDGANFYILRTLPNLPYGSWDTKRPFVLNLDTGQISMNQGLVVNQGMAANGGISVAGGLNADTGSITSTTTGDFGAVNNVTQFAVSGPNAGNAMMSFNSIGAIATKMGVQAGLGFIIGGWSLPANALVIDPSGNLSANVMATGTTVARSLADRATDTFNILDYGGVGDGVHDDAPAWRRAIAAAMQLPGGGARIKVAPLNWTFASKVIVPAGPSGVSKLNFDGGGMASCISPSAAMDALIEIQGCETKFSNISFANAGSFAANGIVHNPAISAYTSEIKDCYFSSFPNAILNRFGNNLIITRNFFVSNFFAYSSYDWGMGTLLSYNTVLGGNGFDFPVPATTEPEGVQILGNNIYPAAGGSYCIRIQSGLEFQIAHNVLAELHAPGACICLDATHANVTSIKIENNWFGSNTASPTTGGYGVQMIGKVNSINVLNGTFSVFTSSGISMVGDSANGLPCQNVVIANNRFAYCTDSDVTITDSLHVKVYGNTFNNPTLSLVRSGTTIITATHNTFTAQPERGPNDVHLLNTGQNALDGLTSGPSAAAFTTVTLSGELYAQSTTLNQLRLVPPSGPSILLRNDGSSFYILKTAAASPNGTFDTARPFAVNLTTGLVALGNGASVTGGLTSDAMTVIAATTGDFGTINNSSQAVVAAPAGGRALMSFNSLGSLATKIGIDPDQGFVIGGWSLPSNAMVLNPRGNLRLVGHLSTADYTHVSAYGVVADGVTDDTAALNAAFLAGGTLMMPPTAMRVTNALNVTIPGTVIKFPSRTSGGFVVSTDFNMNASGVLCLNVPQPYTGGTGANAGPVIENLRMVFNQPNSNNKADYTAYPPAVYSTATTRLHFISPRIVGGWRGMVFSNDCGGATVDNLEIMCFSTHVEMDGCADSMRFTNPHIWPFECLSNQISVFMDPDTIGWVIGRCDDYHITNGLTICGVATVIQEGGLPTPLNGPSFGVWTDHDFDTFGGVAQYCGVATFNGCVFTMGPFATPGGTRTPLFAIQKSGSAQTIVTGCKFLMAGPCQSGYMIGDFSDDAAFTASISGTTMTVTAVSSGRLSFGQVLGANVSGGTSIVYQISGTKAGVGTYALSVSQTVASETMTSPVTGSCFTITGGDWSINAVDQTSLIVSGSGALVNMSGVTITKTANIAYVASVILIGNGRGNVTNTVFSAAGTGSCNGVAVVGPYPWIISLNNMNGWVLSDGSSGKAMFVNNLA